MPLNPQDFVSQWSVCWADVAVEKTYEQLLCSRDALQNLLLPIVSCMNCSVICTNYTNLPRNVQSAN